MSPSKRYNRKNASRVAHSTAPGGGVAVAAKTTKAIKLQKHASGRVTLTKYQSPSAISTLSNAPSSSAYPLSSSQAGVGSAAVLLTSNIDTSLMLEEKNQKAELLATSSRPLAARNRRATAAIRAKVASSMAFDEFSSFGLLPKKQNEELEDNNDDYDNENNKNNSDREYTSRTTPSFKIMSYQSIFALLAVLVCGLVSVNGLKCHMCGQYNEGVGSITPCLNYSDQYAHLYLKECSKKSEKYCVVSFQLNSSATFAYYGCTNIREHSVPKP